MSTRTRPVPGMVEDRDRPAVGDVEQRSAPNAAPTVDGQRLRGLIPYGVESRDLGGFREVISPGALRNARLDDLVATVDHGGVPIGRHPGTLTLEDRADGMHWSLELPEARSDVREAVTRGDLCAGSWRMIVARDRWEGEVRHVEEIAELRDVSVVSTPAYHASVVEHRSQPTTPPAGPTPGQPQRRGTLRVEERTGTSEQPIEARVETALRAIRPGEARSLDTTSAEPVTQEEQASYLWDRLRPASVMLAAGVRVIPTSRESIRWPRLTADVSPDWVAEGDVIPAGDPGLGELEARPRKLAHRVEMTNEVVDDSNPAIVDLLNGHLTTVLALKLDRAMLEGNPAANAESVRGLKYTPGVQSIDLGANGGELHYDHLLEAVGLLRAANVPEPYLCVAHPRTATALTLLHDADGNYLGVPSGVPAIRATSQLSVAEAKGTAANASSVYVLAPAQLVLVRRADATIELDRSRLFDRDMSEMRAKLRADFIAPNPEAVVRVEGIVPAA